MKLTTSDALKTFDFGSKEGTPQSKDTDKVIHNNIVNNPDKPMYDEGETFNEAFKRAIPLAKRALNNEPANTILITHNSVFGLIRLWHSLGMKPSFDKSDREKYIAQDNKFPTGSVYEMKGKSGSLFLIRHGETEDNVAKIYRRANAKLTDKGIKQAEDAGMEVKKMLKGAPVAKIISSPLPRTIETSKIILDESVV